MFMFNKNNWREPIYKQDLLAVLLNGFFIAILGGILGAGIDYVLQVMFHIPLSISELIIMYLVAWRVKKGFYSYHILYPILAVVFLLFAFWVNLYAFQSIVAIQSGFYRIYLFIGWPSFWMSYLLLPVNTLLLGISGGDALGIVMGILNLIFYIFAVWYVYHTVKGKN